MNKVGTDNTGRAEVMGRHDSINKFLTSRMLWRSLQWESGKAPGRDNIPLEAIKAKGWGVRGGSRGPLQLDMEWGEGDGRMTQESVNQAAKERQSEPQ